MTGLSIVGVEFSVEPTEMGTVENMLFFNDTCGNNIQIVEDVMGKVVSKQVNKN